MRLFLPSLIIWLYVSFSFLRLLPWSWPSKALVSLALLMASMKYLLYERLGGSFFAPVLPRTTLVIMEAAYTAVVILFVLLLLHDLFSLLCLLARRFGISSCRLPFSRGSRATFLLLAALLLGIWSTWESIKVPRVHTVEIDIPRLPKTLDGFTLVQLSDIHIRIMLGKDWLQSVVDRTNALSPDLIVLTGDYIDGSVRRLSPSMEPLGQLRARYGIYGVTGNHEFYYGWEAWTKFLEEHGVHMLDNSHTVINAEGGSLVLAGVPDFMSERFGGTKANTAKAFKDSPDAVRILLQHRPQGAWKNGADLQLSGHTHGGALFFLKPLLAHFNEGFVCGLYRKDNMRLYVSPGTGIWSGFSCRLGVPSEITRIILRSPEQKALSE